MRWGFQQGNRDLGLTRLKIVKAKLPRYNHMERAFAGKAFPDIEEAGIIVKMSSVWGARTCFLPKRVAWRSPHCAQFHSGKQIDIEVFISSALP
jgi:hypothetical protein